MTKVHITSLKGVEDILPAQIHCWKFLEQQADALFPGYGFLPIRIPIIELSALFQRSIGSETDIVQKEMYLFKDRGDRELCLRPEATASVARAYLQHNFSAQGLAQFYYYGPMFRGERPQSGRQRQFHQVGVESLGTLSPFADADVIAAGWRYLALLGLRAVTLEINSVGCAQDKPKYAELLRSFLQPRVEQMCELCRQRSSRNILRVLDCKHPQCRQQLTDAPKILESLCGDCRDHWRSVTELLEAVGIPFTVNHQLVRGLDYYTSTVFEFLHSGVGAQSALGAGGRYDGLLAELGGSGAGAVGAAFGMERLLLAMQAESCSPLPANAQSIYLFGIGDSGRGEAFALAQQLRAQHTAVFLAYEERSVKSHMRKADRLGCPFVIMIGENEMQQDSVLIRNMQSGEQTGVSRETVCRFVRNLRYSDKNSEKKGAE